MNPFKDRTTEDLQHMEQTIKFKEKQFEFKRKEHELRLKNYNIDMKELEMNFNKKQKEIELNKTMPIHKIINYHNLTPPPRRPKREAANNYKKSFI